MSDNILLQTINAIIKDLGIVTAYGYAKSKGYTGTEDQFAELMASYGTVAERAADSADAAEEFAEDSEAWAVGQRNGVDVSSEDETYHNNSKYYAEEAATSAATFHTDKTLSVQDIAADGKATGDAINNLRAAVGTPLMASTAGGMTDHEKIYVFTGTTTSSLTNGHWYYWNGSAWADGGVYNSTALETDTNLSVSGMAADAKATGDEITDLKSALNEVGTKSDNLFDKTAITPNTVFYSNGTTGLSDTYYVSDYIPVSGGIVYFYPASDNSLNRVFGYTSIGGSPTGLELGNYTVNSSGYNYIRFSAKNNYLDVMMCSESELPVYTQFGYEKAATKKDLDALGVVVNSMDGYIDNIQTAIGGGTEEETIGTKKTLNTYTSVTSGTNVRFGTVTSSDSGILKSIKLKAQTSGTGTVYLGIYKNNIYKYITKFSVSVTAGENTLVNGIDFTYSPELPENAIIGWLAGPSIYYNNNGETSLNLGALNAESSSYIVESENNYGVSIVGIITVTHPTEIEKIEEIKSPYASANKATFTNEIFNVNTDTAIKKNLYLSFFGTITSFTDLEIGYAYFSSNTSYYDRITVTDTSITVANKNNNSVATYNHGLTIENNIAVIIKMKLDETADITIMSNGETWIQNVSWFRMISTVSPYAKVSSGTTLTDCKLTVSCADYDKFVYAYGDSYFNYAQERWIYYAAQHEFTDNMLLDAHAGEASPAALKCLKEDIKHGKPKYILWCLGMNDGSDTGDDPVAQWKNAIDKVIVTCKEINAIPVFATIPTVATNGTVTRNNENKNAWVRASGYQYIDFAAAVGAGSDGIWYDGMLETTGGGVTERVHPTAKGAKALFMQACVDFPQMIVG